jgi:hypothetical protein
MVGCNAAPKSEENVGPATGAVKQNRLCVEGGNGADRLSAGRHSPASLSIVSASTPDGSPYFIFGEHQRTRQGVQRDERQDMLR